MDMTRPSRSLFLAAAAFSPTWPFLAFASARYASRFITARAAWLVGELASLVLALLLSDDACFFDISAG